MSTQSMKISPKKEGLVKKNVRPSYFLTLVWIWKCRSRINWPNKSLWKQSLQVLETILFETFKHLNKTEPIWALIRFIFSDSSITMELLGFINDNRYKDQLIEMIKQYVLEFVSRILSRSTPFITTAWENEYFISPAENRSISGCNHKDAGTRFVLHSSKVDSDVVVVCKDTVKRRCIKWW